MAQNNLATTTNANPWNQPANTLLDRDPTTGFLYSLVKGTTANTYDVYRSVDQGVTWASLVSLTRANVQEIGSIFVHQDGILYWCYRTNESSQDQIYFRRLNLVTAVWDAEVLTGQPDNGAVAGSLHTGMDIVPVVRTAVGDTFVAIAVGTTFGGLSGVTLYGVYLNAAGSAVYFNNAFSGTRQWMRTGSGRMTPSIDIEHNGDGKVSATPHLWVTFGRTETMLVKLAWNGNGWTGPSAYVEIDSVDPAMDGLPGRWDGTRFIMAVAGAWYANKVTVYERDRSNSSTVRRDTPVHPQGTVRHSTIAYDPISGYLRVYAVGTSTNSLYWVEFNRTGGTWGSWATVSADTVIGTTNQNYGARRSNYGVSRFDAYLARTTSPQAQHVTQVSTVAPSTPTWVAPQNGSAQDVNTGLTLDWNFIDSDPADTQSAYALSRQIGAGALQYYTAAGGTWGGSEVFNSTGTSAVTLASGWGADTDANHTYKVKTRDSTSLDSGYSAAMVVVPSVKADPTITAPTAAQVIATDTVTITWTNSQQSAYRIVLKTGGVTKYDTGKVTSTLKTVIPSLKLADLSSWSIELTTYNTEGLASTLTTRAFSVDYVEPPAPTIVATPITASGVIRVVVTNPAPSGSQPALSSVDLYRRVVGTHGTILNSNPYLESAITGWTGVGGSVARSTAQFHEGTASMLVTPTGGIADSYGESAKVLVSQGVTYVAEAWFRPTTVNKPVKLWLIWYTSGDVLVSSVTAQQTAIAGTWLYLTVTGLPPPTGAKATIAAGVTSTAAAGDTVYVDEAELSVLDASAGTRIAAGLAANTTVDDWKAVALTPFEYMAKATGANGTSIAGPWQA